MSKVVRARRWVGGFSVALMVLAAGCATQPAVKAGGPPAAAAPVDSAKQAAPKPIFIDLADVDYKKVLPRPAETQSPLTRAEGDLLLAMRAEATDAAKARMKGEETFTIWTFADVLGPEFTQAKYPKTAILFKRVENDTYAATVSSKEYFARPRPAQQDARVTALVELPTSASYPSGHATRAIVWSRILSELSPTNAEALRARARLVALDRVIAGVHYPTDVAAGMALGDVIADALLKSPRFRKELDAIRAAEWK